MVIGDKVVELEIEVELGIVDGSWGVEEGVDADADADADVSPMATSPLAVAGVRVVEQDGWMRSAGLGKVLYVEPRDVYPSSYNIQYRTRNLLKKVHTCL